MDKQNYIYKEFLKVSEEYTGILKEFGTDWITVESQHNYETLFENQIKDKFWSDIFLIEEHYNDCWGNGRLTTNRYYDELLFDVPVKKSFERIGLF